MARKKGDIKKIISDTTKEVTEGISEGIQKGLSSANKNKNQPQVQNISEPKVNTAHQQEKNATHGAEARKRTINENQERKSIRESSQNSKNLDQLSNTIKDSTKATVESAKSLKDFLADNISKTQSSIKNELTEQNVRLKESLDKHSNLTEKIKEILSSDIKTKEDKELEDRVLAIGEKLEKIYGSLERAAREVPNTLLQKIAEVLEKQNAPKYPEKIEEILNRVQVTNTELLENVKNIQINKTFNPTGITTNPVEKVNISGIIKNSISEITDRIISLYSKVDSKLDSIINSRSNNYNISENFFGGFNDTLESIKQTYSDSINRLSSDLRSMFSNMSFTPGTNGPSLDLSFAGTSESNIQQRRLPYVKDDTPVNVFITGGLDGVLSEIKQASKSDVITNESELDSRVQGKANNRLIRYLEKKSGLFGSLMSGLRGLRGDDGSLIGLALNAFALKYIHPYLPQIAKFLPMVGKFLFGGALFAGFAANTYDYFSKIKQHREMGEDRAANRKAAAYTTGTIMGTAIGAVFGGPVGILFGTLLGSVIGRIAGDKLASSVTNLPEFSAGRALGEVSEDKRELFKDYSAQHISRLSGLDINAAKEMLNTGNIEALRNRLDKLSYDFDNASTASERAIIEDQIKDMSTVMNQLSTFFSSSNVFGKDKEARDKYLSEIGVFLDSGNYKAIKDELRKHGHYYDLNKEEKQAKTNLEETHKLDNEVKMRRDQAVLEGKALDYVANMTIFDQETAKNLKTSLYSTLNPGKIIDHEKAMLDPTAMDIVRDMTKEEIESKLVKDTFDAMAIPENMRTKFEQDLREFASIAIEDMKKATSPEERIKIFKAYAEDAQALVTGIVMPPEIEKPTENSVDNVKTSVVEEKPKEDISVPVVVKLEKPESGSTNNLDTVIPVVLNDDTETILRSIPIDIQEGFNTLIEEQRMQYQGINPSIEIPSDVITQDDRMYDLTSYQYMRYFPLITEIRDILEFMAGDSWKQHKENLAKQENISKASTNTTGPSSGSRSPNSPESQYQPSVSPFIGNVDLRNANYAAVGSEQKNRKGHTMVSAFDINQKDIARGANYNAALDSIMTKQQKQSYIDMFVKGGTITAGLGNRDSLGGGASKDHEGIDIAKRAGADITSPFAGVVKSSGYKKGYGNVIDIDHGGGFVTRYAHLSDEMMSQMQTGKQIAAGEVIGKMGNTGTSVGKNGGYHLHLEAIKNGKKYDTMLLMHELAKQQEEKGKTLEDLKKSGNAINVPDALSRSGFEGGKVDTGIKAPTKNMQNVMTQYGDHISAMSKKYGVPENVIYGMIQTESGGRVDAVSGKDAVGLMQLKSDAAKDMGVKDRFDPYQNIEGGTKYISRMMKQFGGDPEKALQAYNWGPGNMKKYLAGQKTSMPKETQDYVNKVLGAASKYSLVESNIQTEQPTQTLTEAVERNKSEIDWGAADFKSPVTQNEYGYVGLNPVAQDTSKITEVQAKDPAYQAMLQNDLYSAVMGDTLYRNMDDYYSSIGMDKQTYDKVTGNIEANQNIDWGAADFRTSEPFVVAQKTEYVPLQRVVESTDISATNAEVERAKIAYASNTTTDGISKSVTTGMESIVETLKPSETSIPPEGVSESGEAGQISDEETRAVSEYVLRYIFGENASGAGVLQIF